MEGLLAVVVGVLYGAGFYMLLRRSLVKVIVGVALLSHATNVFLFTVGGLTRGRVPLVDEGLVPEPFADPLPQALILTAIVIGFGVQVFAIVLFKRLYLKISSDDLRAAEISDAVPGSGKW